MRVLSRLCSVVAWTMLVVAVFFQILLILTLWMPPFFDALFPGDRVDNPVNDKALPFLVTGAVLFIAGYFLFRFMRRGRWIWFAVMLIGAALLAGVGLYLKNHYPETIYANERYGGYNSVGKLVWRHFTPAFTVVFHFLAVLLRQIAEGRELRREALAEIKAKGIEPKYE